MPDTIPLAQMPGHLIRRLHQHSSAVYQDRVKQAGFDVTSVQFAALSTLESQPGLDQASLAKRIAYDRATIGGVVKRLVHKGYVERLPDEEDRRAFKLWLTPEGMSALQQLKGIVTALQGDILGTLTEDEKDMLLRLIAKALDVPS